ncbi:MAG: neutral/alkaline non-lysosomal ceramidase N-terminal domain-containing protein, partial [Verrucomicrobiota bacterium]
MTLFSKSFKVFLKSALLLTSGALFFSFTPSLKGNSLEAGLSAVEITPTEWPVTLRGSFNPKKAESAHDPLRARSLAVKNGDGRLVLTVVDILFLGQDLLDSIKEEASQRCGWPAEVMLISGTHTHSAPSPDGGSDDPAEIAFRTRAFEGIVNSIVTAVEALEPARLGFASEEEPSEVCNRRWYLEDGKMPLNPFGGIDKVKMNPPRDLIVKPAGPTDPEIAVISVQRRNGKPMGLFANYALHYVGSIPGGQVSADYFGEFARLVPFRIAGRNPPPDFVAILSNGTSGDINNIDFLGTRAPRAPFEQIRQVATKVADAAHRATQDLEYASNLPVAMVERRITLKTRKPSESLLEKSKAILEMTGEELKEQPRLASHYALRVLALDEGPESVDVAIQAGRIGDQAILALPFEVLVEIGMELKEESPFSRTLIVGLANGAFGYLPPPHQHELGGYETWLGTCRVEEKASEK